MSNKLSFGVRKAKAKPALDAAKQAAAFDEPDQALTSEQAAAESRRLQVRSTYAVHARVSMSVRACVFV